MIIPKFLKKGDTIAITCPAGFMLKKNAATAIKALKKEGYNVLISPTVGGNSKTYFSGTDQERLDEFQKYMDDKNVKAILCGRGGYGCGRIIDKLNFTKFIKNPKWIIGFSDITILLNHIISNFNIASLHGPMTAGFGNETQNPENVVSLLNTLKGVKNNYEIQPHASNNIGNVKGKLVGGNLCLLANAIGTPSDIKTKNCILFIEEIGEVYYAVDRMMHQLKRSGKLANLAALVVGSFTDATDTTRPFGKNIHEIITDLVAEYNYPVCFDFPVGHGVENRALKNGVTYKLNCTKEKVSLEEI
jgi:muramoyltetrapeptide carboxypeptidase